MRWCVITTSKKNVTKSVCIFAFLCFLLFYAAISQSSWLLRGIGTFDIWGAAAPAQPASHAQHVGFAQVKLFHCFISILYCVVRRAQNAVVPGAGNPLTAKKFSNVVLEYIKKYSYALDDFLLSHLFTFCICTSYVWYWKLDELQCSNSGSVYTPSLSFLPSQHKASTAEVLQFLLAYWYCCSACLSTPPCSCVLYQFQIDFIHSWLWLFFSFPDLKTRTKQCQFESLHQWECMHHSHAVYELLL